MSALSAARRLFSNKILPQAGPVRTMPPDASFPKASRILKRRDFRRVYDQGVRFSSRLFTAFCLDTADSTRTSGARVGFTVPRAVGKSVARNRIRRRMREAIRPCLVHAGPQWDLVLNPRRSVLAVPFAELQDEVRKLLGRCKP